MEKSLQLTPRFTLAVDYARQVHVSLRKGTQVPYMAHLLGVASLVLGETGHVPFPVTEDMAIAALLHDAVEDEGGLPRLRDIEAKFGNNVAKIVEGCTDSFVEYPDKKQEWEERKSSYTERLWLPEVRQVECDLPEQRIVPRLHSSGTCANRSCLEAKV